MIFQKTKQQMRAVSTSIFEDPIVKDTTDFEVHIPFKIIGEGEHTNVACYCGK